MKKLHYFFDMDGTLTPSRKEMHGAMVSAITTLADDADIVIVSGARFEQICTQVGHVIEFCATLAQNGNDSRSFAGTHLWKNELNWKQTEKVKETIAKMSNHHPVAGSGLQLIEDRGCQISYSITGHAAEYEVKAKADPDRSKRKKLLEDFKQEITDLAALGIMARIGGSTCIDFCIATKGQNVLRFIEKMAWPKEECVYYGDALFPGGNDESVVGVIDTVEVSGPEDTLAKITL